MLLSDFNANLIHTVGSSVKALVPEDMSFSIDIQQHNIKLANSVILRIPEIIKQPYEWNNFKITFVVDLLITIERHRSILKLPLICGTFESLLLSGFSISGYGCFDPSSNVTTINYGQANKESTLIASSLSCSYSNTFSEE